MKKLVSNRVISCMSLLTAGGAVLLLSQCRTPQPGSQSRAVSSETAAASDENVKTFKLVGEKGRYKVLFPNSGRGFKPGDSVSARYGVVQKRSGDAYTCDSLPSSESVTLKLDGKDLAMDVKVAGNAFDVCTDAGDDGRKLSLKCQQSGDWDGPKLLELCLTASDGTKVLGRAAPSLESKSGFGLAGQMQHDDDIVNYGKVCAERLGALPRDWSCLDGEVIPITVDGVELGFEDHKMNQKCDKPAYLGLGEQGQCVPYARLGRIKTGPNVETVFICRRYNVFKPEIDPTTGRPNKNANGDTIWTTERYAIEENAFQDVAIVQHNIKTGESCFFQALAGFRGGKDLPTARIPPPDEETVPDDIKDKYTKETLADGAPNPTFMKKPYWPEATQGFWIKPSAPNTSGVPGRGFECTICHDSDAYMHSPYVDQLNYTYPEGHDLAGIVDKMVPCNPGEASKLPNTECAATKKGLATGKMSLVHEQHQKWKRALHIAPKDDDTCVRCHRMGSINTCARWAQDSAGGNTIVKGSRTTWSMTYPESHWMPITDEFMKEWKDRTCKPNLADPANPEGCSQNLAQWRQTFEDGAKKTLECCNLHRTNSSQFAGKCTAEPITADPPAAGGRDSVTLTSAALPIQVVDFDKASNKPGVTKIALDPPTTQATGTVSHIKVTMRLDHDRHTNLKVRVRNGEKQAMIYNGQEEGYPGADGELNISFNSADDQERFGELMDTDVGGDWSIEVEDTKLFETGAVTAAEAIISFN